MTFSTFDAKMRSSRIPTLRFLFLFGLISLLTFHFSTLNATGNEENDSREDPLIVITGETGSGKRVSVFLKHFSYGSGQPLVFAAIIVDLPGGRRKILHLHETGMTLPEGWKSQREGKGDDYEIDGIANVAWDSFDKEGVPHLILCLKSSRARLTEASLDIRFVGPEGGKTGVKNGINYLTFSWPDEGVEIELAELKVEFSDAF